MLTTCASIIENAIAHDEFLIKKRGGSWNNSLFSRLQSRTSFWLMSSLL